MTPNYKNRLRSIQDRKTIKDGSVVIGLFSCLLALNIGVSKITIFQTICLVLFIGFFLRTLLAPIRELIGYIQNLRRERLEIRYGFTDIDTMTGMEFERYIGTLLKTRGCTDIYYTEHFDRGADIIATNKGETWAIQAKRQSSLVSKHAVEQVVSSLNYYGCTRAMVIANGIFSARAIEAAQFNNCVLMDRKKLTIWIQESMHA